MRGRKGSLNYVLSRTVDIIFSALIVLLILFIAFSLYKVFWAEDKLVTNQYQLVGDMLQGVIEAPGEGGVTEREFAFTFVPKGGEKSFEGTIFARSSDGTWTSSLPPINWYTRDIADGQTFSGEFITRQVKSWQDADELSLKRVDKTCDGKACLCLSKKKLVSSQGDKDLLAALKAISDCRAFTIPPGKTHLILDFESFQRVEQDNPWYLNLFGAGDSEPVYDDGLYPVISLFKSPCDERQTGYPSTAVCVYGSLGEEEST